MDLEDARGHEGETLVYRFDGEARPVRLLKVLEHGLRVQHPGCPPETVTSLRWYSLGRAEIIMWDWQEQAPMEVIGRAAHEMSARGQVFMREFETGADCYTWIVSDYPVDDAEAERLDYASTFTPDELAEEG